MIRIKKHLIVLLLLSILATLSVLSMSTTFVANAMSDDWYPPTCECSFGESSATLASKSTAINYGNGTASLTTTYIFSASTPTELTCTLPVFCRQFELSTYEASLRLNGSIVTPGYGYGSLAARFFGCETYSDVLSLRETLSELDSSIMVHRFIVSATEDTSFSFSLQEKDHIMHSFGRHSYSSNTRLFEVNITPNFPGSFLSNGKKYPSRNEDGTFDYETVVKFLEELYVMFKWDKYESKTLGAISEDGSHKALRYYAVILTQWMEGYGLKSIIDKAIFYKKTHFETTVNINGRPEYYNDSRLHKNAVTAETLTIIDHTILFSLANYFLRFSTEYKKQHHVENFDNDWYEFVEYGSTNPLTILLQRNGFSRETSTYIKQNQGKYVEVTASGPKLKISLLECPKESVRSEVQDIQYNIPEIFIK